ncbi:hypothetical protein [Ornithinimicrobium flavum]|uniref:hypothetical protein n=1 Tax=Ornithinimicrobium flavum TaxID=1288636 RepID=UPI0010704723|nr:hypothetical protein [Ornithinimicrobium flavum]
MRRTITTVTALVAAVGLAACSPETESETATEDTATVEETTEAAEEAATSDDAAMTSEGASAGMDDPVCEEFFMGQGQPLAERAGTTRDLLETGDPLDPVSYSELSLLQSRIDMLGEEASADQAGLLERVNAPFTEVVDAVVADNARMEEEITIPEVDVTDSAAAQDELEAACAG